MREGGRVMVRISKISSSTIAICVSSILFIVFSLVYTNTTLGAPPAPTKVQARSSTQDDAVDVTWNAARDASLYVVYRSESVTGDKTQLGQTYTRFYSDKSATPCQKYYYWVKAVSPFTGVSDFSSPADGFREGRQPSLATGVSATDHTFMAVRVTWNASSGPAVFYVVTRAVVPRGSRKQLGSTSHTAYIDPSAIPGVTYEYCVLAKNECGGRFTADPSSCDIGSRGGLTSDPERIPRRRRPGPGDIPIKPDERFEPPPRGGPPTPEP